MKGRGHGSRVELDENTFRGFHGGSEYGQLYVMSKEKAYLPAIWFPLTLPCPTESQSLCDSRPGAPRDVKSPETEMSEGTERR